MITVENVGELRDGLLELINDEIEAYGKDSGWEKFSKEELNKIVDRFINEVTDKEIDNWYDNDDDLYGDRGGAIMCYLNEWVDNDDLIDF